MKEALSYWKKNYLADRQKRFALLINIWLSALLQRRRLTSIAPRVIYYCSLTV